MRYLSLILFSIIWLFSFGVKNNLEPSYEKINIPSILYYLPKEDEDLKELLKNN